DPGLVQALREVLEEYSNVEVIQGDILTVDLPEVNRIVSNLPYSISSPITFRLLEEAVFEWAVLMYQGEYAHRLLASPGTSYYSRLSVDVQYLAHIEYLMEVPATDFYPFPSVDSEVVRIHRRRNGIFAQDKEVFFWLVHGIYSYPNKVLRKALRIWLKNIEKDKTLVDDIIRRSSGAVDGGERLRSLDQEKLVTLADGVLDLIEEGTLPDPRGKSN
ncbi:MAG: ribosomal RNA small subunit methyltransferase A, partial [Candidatus Thorarchaeota archaeon]